MHDVVPFNRPFIAGTELSYISEVTSSGTLSSDGHFTDKCARFLQDRLDIRKVLLTPSGTAALELAAILCDFRPGDEVIMPSYTFVSTASAVMRLGAKPVFVDIRPDTLNIDETKLERAISSRTKAVFVVHYGGVSCEMDHITSIARQHKLLLVEDAAQAVNAFYKGRALGTIGHLGCYSFHDTKNYTCGEGGALCINDERFVERAEIVRDKGTNRRQFLRGDLDKYTWVDVGSSYLLSELCSAFLYGQLEMLDTIARYRQAIYSRYFASLNALACDRSFQLPHIPEDCLSNNHMFYLLLSTAGARDRLLAHLKADGIHAAFHYIPLHTSPMGERLGYSQGNLPITEDVASRIVRLPMYCEITPQQLERVAASVKRFLGANHERDHDAATTPHTPSPP